MRPSTLALLLAASGAGALTPCVNDQQCVGLLPTGSQRCLPSKLPGAWKCTLDAAYNATGECACQPQSCVAITGCVCGARGACLDIAAWLARSPTPPPRTVRRSPAFPSRKQLLVIGDSISLGYMPSLNASLAGEWEVAHPGENCGSAYHDMACMGSWLGTNPSRWDAVTLNAGLHDLAFPDNEHVDVDLYAVFLANATAALAAALKPSAAIVWVRTSAWWGRGSARNMRAWVGGRRGFHLRM